MRSSAPPTSPARRALPLTLATALALGTLVLVPTVARADDTATIRGGSLSWGFKSSFRSYLLSGVAHGTITATAPATDEGGRTTFASAAGTWATDTASVATTGSVRYYGHDGALDVTVANPEIRIASGTATLVADVTDSAAVVHDDLALASLDLTGAVSNDGNIVTVTNAPATITADGADVFSYGGHAFYPAGTALDPVSASFTVKHATPKLTVSKTTFTTRQTATVTVTGKDFYPEDSVATRPPLAGKSSGLYLVVGKFAQVWQPSAGAASTARKALATQTKWAVLAGDMATIGGPAAGAIELSADGSFTAELTFSRAQLDAITGLTGDHVNYGIYTYPGGGATKAAWETYTQLTFTEPAPTSIALSAPAITVGGAAKVTATVSASAATGTVTLTGAGDPVTATLRDGTAEFSVPGLGAASYALTASYAGDELFAASETAGTLTVAKVAGSPGVTAPTSTYGTAARVTVWVPSGATGTVTLSGAGISAQTATVNNEAAQFTLPAGLTPGSRTLTAAYSGDASHEAATTTVALVVAKARATAKVSVSTKPRTKKTGKATVAITGPAAVSKPTGKATVKFVKGKKSRTVTVKLSSGAKKLTVPKLAKGTWTIQVKYAGDSRYAALGYLKVGTVKVTR